MPEPVVVVDDVPAGGVLVELVELVVLEAVELVLPDSFCLQPATTNSRAMGSAMSFRFM